MSVFEYFLVRIFPHSDWIRRDTDYPAIIIPNGRKYGPGKLRIRTFFTHCVCFPKWPHLYPTLLNLAGLLLIIALHKKWSFPLRISSVNVTKSAGNSGFGHICWRDPIWKTSFSCAAFAKENGLTRTNNINISPSRFRATFF